MAAASVVREPKRQPVVSIGPTTTLSLVRERGSLPVPFERVVGCHALGDERGEDPGEGPSPASSARRNPPSRSRGSFAGTVWLVRELDAIPPELHRQFLDRVVERFELPAATRVLGTSGSTWSPTAATCPDEGPARQAAGQPAGSRLVYDRRARMSARDGEQRFVGRGRGEVFVRREHDLVAAMRGGVDLERPVVASGDVRGAVQERVA